MSTHLSASAEKKRSEGSKVAPPYHPRVHARRLDRDERHAPYGEPIAECAVWADQRVFCAARDPQQPQARIVLRVYRRKGRVEIVQHSTGTERPDPTERLRRVQADIERLRATHRNAGDGA